MAFNEVLGQELAVTVLQNGLQQDRLHHAYLFAGESGVGKEKVAFEFAKAINCEQKKADACDQCISCQKSDSGNHPDLKQIKPDGSYLKIDQIRELRQEILYKPYESKRKVYIIYQVDRMTTEAANSLLKTLEAPPPHGVLILLTDNLNQLLPTVISRCELVRFKRVPDKLIEERLAADYQLSAEERQLITSLAFGKVKSAVQLVEEEAGLSWRQEIIDILLSLDDLNRIKVFKIGQELLEFKDRINEVLDVFLTWYRDILLCKLEAVDNLVNAHQADKLKELAADLSLTQVEEIIELIAETNNQIRHVNVNLQLTLEVMLLKLNQLKEEK